MKLKFIWILCGLFILTTTAFSQSVYFGYPPTTVGLKKGDLIILTIPDNTDGRFKETERISELVQFISDRPDNMFNIQINVFYGTPEFGMAYSEHLKRSMQKILKNKCKKSNYCVVARGHNNPIFLNTDSALYRKINTRMEILIE